MEQKTALNPKKVEELVFKIVGDVGGGLISAQAYLGDRLGLFKAMADGHPVSAGDLARKTNLNERYVLEWLKAMTAAEYIEYDPTANKFWMTPEQAFVLANEDAPYFMGGGFHSTLANILNMPKILDVFQKGGGVSLEELGRDVTEGVERLFRPGYLNHLVQVWLPTIPGLVQKLEKGGNVLDIGCGCGQSTIAMAKAFPNSKFLGVDPDHYSIERAKKLASENKLSNVEFLKIAAQEVSKEKKYDLICAFDCIHDMADPVRTLMTVRELLKEDGVFLWVEPNASDNPLENRNPIGKIITGVSPFYCLTVSMAHHGKATGNQLGERGARALASEAGFSHFEKLPIENPINQFFLLKK
jgi:2-polyprenyl-3-methyl-5-hydroxy-6-metoxy-1,4-benzoquinol methylase